LEAFQTVPEIKSYLRHRVIEQLHKAAQQAGRRAALEGGALIAVMPSPALDGITAATRGLILIRQVAQIYGLKPSPFVILALIRKVAWTAAGVSGLDLLSQTLADHTLQKLPLVQHLAGAVPGTSAAAIRIYRLANITAEACSPLPAS
jgi:putative membrane protein